MPLSYPSPQLNNTLEPERFHVSIPPHPFRMRPLRLILLGQLQLLVLLGAEKQAARPALPGEVASYLRASKAAETDASFSLVAPQTEPKAVVKALVTQTKDGRLEQALVTVIRVANGFRIKERTQLLEGATPADVELVRAAILAGRQADFQKAVKAFPERAEQKAPTADDTLISSLTKTKAGFEADFETDQQALNGVGAHVKLSRLGDGSLTVTASQGFKK